MRCIDDTNDPCYWRGPDHTCTRGKGDGPCCHASRIIKRKQEEERTNDK